MVNFHVGFPAPSISELKMSDNAPLAQLCEQLGFETLWHTNQRFSREMFVRMTSSAIATSRIGIGGAIAEVFAVHPIITAQTLATLNELAAGRATLALGAGGSGFQMMGLKRERSAVALKEAYQVMKSLLAGEELTFEGEIIKAYNAHLDFKPEYPTTLWIATRGDQTLSAAGGHADAVMIATYATPQGVSQALDLIEKGARRAGRSLDAIRMMSRVDTCVHRNYKFAMDGSREMVARFLWSSFPDRKFIERTGLRVPDTIETLIAKRDYGLIPSIAKIIPDEFVEGFCWSGTPENVAQKILAIYKSTGIREFGFWVLLAADQTRAQAVRMISEEVFPLIREKIVNE